ncbi:oxysterol-binding protein-related protein 6-like isoform X2 [Planococcus citri]|uniref:oxysterol-binding protein-related protein 6-like isoform X2 n=1 Tax=Planococcus citri TaxID=170843 RepID=UPI0031F98887
MTTGLRHSATEPGSLQTDRFVEAMPKKKSPQLLSKMKNTTGTASESEGSLDSSPSVESCKESHNQKKITRRGSEWEILEGLKEGQRFDKKPEMFSGYLHKKRKWPLKGWHKRYFILDKGLLTYGKGPSEIARGKIHGHVDIGLSVISTKGKRKRIDIDADEFIHHLKAKRHENFLQWVEQLKKHRLYRQHVLTFGNVRHVQGRILKDMTKPMKDTTQLLLHGGQNMKVHSPPPRLTAWVMDSNSPLERASKELEHVHQHLHKLSSILNQIDSLMVESEVHEVVSLSDGLSPNSKKDKRRFGLRKKKSNNCSLSWGGNKGSSGDLTSNANLTTCSPCKSGSVQEAESSSPVSTCSLTVGLTSNNTNTSLSSSNPAINNTITQTNRHISLSTPLSADGHPDSIQTCSDTKIFSDYVSLAKEIHENLYAIIKTLYTERDRLKTALESDSNNSGSQAVIKNLQNSLLQTIQQNNELRTRLNNIHATSDISQLSDSLLKQSLSYNSLYVSASDIFFDAEEFHNVTDNENELEDRVSVPETQIAASDTSSEAGSISSEEGSMSSENSEGAASDYNSQQNVIGNTGNVENMTGHRDKLPCPRPNTEGLSLWNLLRRNIGKDLSQVSMPVALNEPLNMLQRLCEELEYSELLDKAVELEDPYERMVYVAAFAVSGYGSSSCRAGSKPFNPLLGETYECIREDKGFKFISEQVSHHPPVSVCHAESKNFVFWQDMRIKTKFWGKSMEFQPIGYVNLKILRPDCQDHYRWNKVTTCVHNLFSGQRWADLYGELKINNLNRDISCKLTFVKANYWSAKRHEVYGNVFDENGTVVRKLFGKWNEALYCGVPPSAKCIWRPGTMPENYEMYYGFTRFAIELNELDPETAKHLPKTDTRFRPDQRLLEEGDLNGAESVKLQLEQSQRERRKKMEECNTNYQPKWFRKKYDEDGEEIWEFDGKYWDVRKNGGFNNMNLDQLW